MLMVTGVSMNPFLSRNIISIKDFTRQELEYLFTTADKIQNLDFENKKKLASGKRLGLLFFEPSTRTRLSFEASMLDIGGNVLGFSEPKVASVEKGENLADTIKTVEGYVDAIVLRHRMEGSARFAAEVSSIPIIICSSFWSPILLINIDWRLTVVLSIKYFGTVFT